MEGFLATLHRLQYPEQWITRSGGLIFVAFISTVWGGIVLSTGPRPLGVTLLLLPLLPVLSAILWFIGRAIYFHSGNGIRIGISYGHYDIPLEDWARARKYLNALANSDGGCRKIVIKLMPQAWLETDPSDKQYRRVKQKYNLDVGLFVSKADSKQLEINVPAVDVEHMSDGFQKATFKHVQAAFASDTAPPTPEDAFKWHAKSIYECVLAVASAIAFTREQFDIAYPIAEELDSRLKDRFRPNQEPRVAFRWLAMRSRIARSVFSASDPPGPIELEKAVGEARVAAELYSKDFPEVVAHQARDEFFLGRFEIARLLNNELGDLCGDHPVAKAVWLVNEGALSVLEGLWTKGTEAFESLLEVNYWKLLDWDDLVQFADCADEQGYSNAVYLQGLYRRIKGKDHLSKALETKVLRWVNDDKSRGGLQRVFWKARQLR